MKTFQYCLYPDKDQQSKLWLHANKLNYLYNYFLNQRIEAYKVKTKISKSDQQKELVNLKQSDSVIKEIHSQVLQQVTLRLDNSYKNFFRRIKDKSKEVGFPKFRSCKNFFGICYPQSGFSIKDNILKTKVYGSIKFSKHRNYLGNIKQIYITTKNNKWFLNITTDASEQQNKTKEVIGIDIGLKYLVVDSNGNKIKNNRHAKHFDKQISKLQSRKDKLKKNSNECRHLAKVIQKLYELKRKKIDDFQHKVSRNLSRKYDTIFAEDLSVKKMSESEWTRLNKSIRNAKLAQFISFLSYKVNNLILVNPRNTSKICNSCGFLHKNLELKDRIINCECGIVYDRDENAAKNVYCLGQAIVEGQCIQSATIEEVLTLK
jgi:putative transposase